MTQNLSDTPDEIGRIQGGMAVDSVTLQTEAR